MKRLALLTLALLSLSNAAHAARQPKIYTYFHSIHFEKDAKYPVTMNLMDDGINLPDGYDQFEYGVKFVLRNGEQFRVAVKADNGGDGDVRCSHTRPERIPLRGGRTLVFAGGKARADGPACRIPFSRWKVGVAISARSPGSSTETSP